LDDTKTIVSDPKPFQMNLVLMLLGTERIVNYGMRQNKSLCVPII